MRPYDSLRERAHKTAEQRARLYGIEPPPEVTDLLAREDPSFRFQEAIRLLHYTLYKSPSLRLQLWWQYVSDRDTPARVRRLVLLARDLREQLDSGCRVAVNYFERWNTSRDLARVPPFLEKALHRTTPALVVQPRSEQDITRVLVFCRSRGLAVFPRGSGSFAFGGAVPTRYGIVLDLSPMRAVLEIDPQGHTIRVQPGARWADVAAALEPYGLIPVTTPTSRFSTVAGWVSTGGMGLDSYAYGSVHEAVRNVRIVRPDGSIEKLDAEDAPIQDLFGTEGQFGILTEITLRVRLRSEHSGAVLLPFDSPDQALEFIQGLRESEVRPSHVAFFDQEYLKKENLLFAAHTRIKDSLFTEQDAVLLHFETKEDEQRFQSTPVGKADRTAQNRSAAHILWSDRYFPLKAQRLSPGLLGSEAMIPETETAGYLSGVRRLARLFGLKPTIEVIACRQGTSHSHLVIVSFSCDYSRSFHYVLSLLFIQLLVRLAVRSGGHPYGIGIWNTPFIKSRYDQGILAGLRERKHSVDPEETLNPHKFFKVKGRFLSIPALAMRPLPFRLILAAARGAAPVLGLLARMTGPKQSNSWDVPTPEDDQGRSLLHQCAQRCTSCGSCLSVCPAYHVTGDELVAGRTKLRLAEALMRNVELEREEAHAPFQCLHCGLCEEVCQTRLPLRDCYLVLESWLEDRFGPPSETVQRFVEKLDADREYLKDVFGLDLPEWSPEDTISRVPAVEPVTEGGEA
ncbi:MAG: FAD-binding protein [Candidatus Aminicenantaceae bacterium]